MHQRTVEADYVIVGAGAVAMAFADTLLTDSSATMIMVDRRHKPGGHWNDAYPFVRLHGPSANYGVNSRKLGSDAIDQAGFNRGLHELATGAEICAYFDKVMRQRFLPSGRVTYLPLSDYADDGVVTSRISGARAQVQARRKVVDATFSDTRIPATHPPDFPIAAGVRCVPPNALAQLREPCAGFVIIGAGKTAMDTAVWLLEHGADPHAITWIRPRDAWLLNRANVQPRFEFFAQTVGGFATEMEAARDARSIADLFARLESANLLRRIDTTVTPTMYRCAIVSDAELEQMRRITQVVRLGHVIAIEPERIVLEHGAVPTTPAHVHVDCTADGLARKPTEPIFQGERIVPQAVRRCQPTFSAALAAHVEATCSGDAEKNSYCAPVTLADEPLDWLRMQLGEARNSYRWSRSPELQKWLVRARLDMYSSMIARAMHEPTAAHTAILDRYRMAIKPGLARLAELLAEAEGARG